MTAKLLLMSDIHITEPGTQIIGLDPSAGFGAAWIMPPSIMRMPPISSLWAI